MLSTNFTVVFTALFIFTLYEPLVCSVIIYSIQTTEKILSKLDFNRYDIKKYMCTVETFERRGFVKISEGALVVNH